MTAQELLSRLEGVRKSGRGWMARCPQHEDRSQSLSVCQGSDGRILLHCFALCETDDIVAAMGSTMADLFPDVPGSRTAYRERVRRTQERRRKAHHDEVDGFTIDVLREADYFTRSRQRLDISTWNNDRLNDELDALADAYALLWIEEITQWT